MPKTPLPDLALGKLEKKEDPRTLRFADYLPGGPKAAKRIKTLPTPPSSLDYLSKIADYPLWYNDRLGDCGPEMVGHAEQTWTGNVGKLWTPGGPDVLKVYEDVGGYRPANPSDPQTNATDNGVYLLDLMNYWRHTGIAGHRITAFAALDTKDRVQVKQAVHIFGSVLQGVMLPLTAADQLRAKKRWTVVSSTGRGKAGSWGGHAITLGRYTTQTAYSVTWGMQWPMAWTFLIAYGDESYVALSDDWVDQVKKKAPNGFDVAALQADLTQFRPV
jgi:hypothetical protein